MKSMVIKEWIHNEMILKFTMQEMPAPQNVGQYLAGQGQKTNKLFAK